ncbi:hypothetical protein LshimejAT787_1500350 [Lyophyllum shimeji]|uniref:Uncharacterized protein n=1 Tax=Lyophyllum shimeji TaxID=47721 RepID=A0A9P3PYC4_LYOSH|nr:hypothetical protein LshimejAT787_1500350 [Lyophyllum shimeji]
MVQGLLAHTKQQRLKYKDWLYVYAKDLVRMPARLSVLVDDYQSKLLDLGTQENIWYRDKAQLYDIFEPEYIADALNRKSPPPLGRLIFGKELWAQLGGDTDDPKDPVSLYFLQKYMDHELKTFLRPICTRPGRLLDPARSSRRPPPASVLPPPASVLIPPDSSFLHRRIPDSRLIVAPRVPHVTIQFLQGTVQFYQATRSSYIPRAHQARAP